MNIRQGPIPVQAFHSGPLPGQVRMGPNALIEPLGMKAPSFASSKINRQMVRLEQEQGGGWSFSSTPGITTVRHALSSSLNFRTSRIDTLLKGSSFLQSIKATLASDCGLSEENPAHVPRPHGWPSVQRIRVLELPGDPIVPRKLPLGRTRTNRLPQQR